MLQREPKDRPTAEECLTHMAFQLLYVFFDINKILGMSMSILRVNLIWVKVTIRQDGRIQ